MNSIGKKFTKNEISFGLENYAQTNELNGGNYIFASYHHEIFYKLSLGAKISSDLTPHSFEDVVGNIGIRYNTAKNMDGFNQLFGLYYCHNRNSINGNADFINLEISLLNYCSDDVIEIDFFPIGLLYSLDAEKLSLMYKFIGFKFRF